MPDRPSQKTALLAAALGVFILSVMDAAIKYASVGFPTAQIVMMRYLCGLPLALAYWLPARTDAITPALLKVHSFRGLLVLATASQFFYALSVLPLADAVALSFLAPLLVGVMAFFLLGEPLGRHVVGGILIGLAGVAVIWIGQYDIAASQTGNSDRRLWGILAAVGCAFTYALNLVQLRERAQQDHPATIVFLQHLLPLVAITPFGLAVWIMPKGIDWALFAAIGALGVGGHLCLVYAYKRARAGLLGVVDYTALIWSAALGFAAFGEIPPLATWAGAGLIIFACLWAARR